MNKYDVIIIGGGPAGMAAALWCAEFGLTSVLIESGPELGGQLNYVYNRIENYPGLAVKDGNELRRLFLNCLDRRKFDVLLGTAVTVFDLSSRSVITDSNKKMTARSLVIATGVRRRVLGVPGEKEFLGHGIMISGAKEAELTAGKNVVVIGGGDAAIENALVLSERARNVTVVHRSETFRARDSFLESARSRPNIQFLTDRLAVSFEGSSMLETVVVNNISNDHAERIDCDLALVRIGVEPNSDAFYTQLALDDKGYIIVTSRCETSVKNVYAIGDIANPNSLNISTATGNAAAAISHITDVMKREKPNPKI